MPGPGGPGAAAYYLEPLEERLAEHRPVVVYDQLGCGRSDMPDDPSLWTIDYFTNEVDQMREALGLDAKRFADLDLPWGTALTPGGRTGDPVNLFPRIETADGAKTAGRAAGAKAKPDRRS